MAELFLLLGVGYFFVILLTMYKRGSRGRVARSLIFYALFSLIGVVIQYLVQKGVIGSTGDSISKWFPLLSILFLSIWFVSLSRDFLVLRVNSNLWVIFGFCWLVAVITTIAILTSRPEMLASGLNQDTLFWLLIVLGYVLMMGGVAILTIRAYRQVKAPLHRNRIF